MNPSSGSHDIIVVGLQESVYDKPDGFISAEQHLYLKLHEAVGQKNYAVVGECSMTPRTDKTYKDLDAFQAAVKAGKARPSGIRCAVYCRRELVRKIPESSVEMQLKPTGRLEGGASGNKVTSSRIFEVARPRTPKA